MMRLVLVGLLLFALPGVASESAKPSTSSSARIEQDLKLLPTLSSVKLLPADQNYYKKPFFRTVENNAAEFEKWIDANLGKDASEMLLYLEHFKASFQPKAYKAFLMRAFLFPEVVYGQEAFDAQVEALCKILQTRFNFLITFAEDIQKLETKIESEDNKAALARVNALSENKAFLKTWDYEIVSLKYIHSNFGAKTDHYLKAVTQLKDGVLGCLSMAILLYQGVFEKVGKGIENLLETLFGMQK